MKLADLCALGIDASLDGHGGLLLDAPKGVLVPDLVERIRHAKPALVAEIMGKCEVGEHGELGSSMFTPGGKGMPHAGHVHTGIPAPRWRVTFADAKPLTVHCAPPATLAEMQAAYPDALSIEPQADPPAAPLPDAEASELAALLTAVYPDAQDREEAAEIAQRDPRGALVCYRAIVAQRGLQAAPAAARQGTPWR